MNSNNNEFDKLVKNMESSKVGAVFFLGVNPAYDYRLNKAFTSALSKVDVRVSFAMAKDETAALCNYIAPTNHTYESWSDSQVSHDEFSFTQPVIQPLFGTRMAMETLMAHAGIKGNFHDFVKSNWKSNFFNTSGAAGDNKWNNALHEGVVTLDGYSKMLSGSFGSVEGIITSISKTTYPNMSVELYQKSAMTNGHMANNPWLHEMPDPVTKATWDNYIMVSPKYAKSNGLKSGDVCVLKSSTHSVKLPVIVQPGTDTATFGVAVGYGRRVAGKVAKNLGANAFGFSNHESVTLAKTGEFNGLAQTQTHHSMEGRDIIRETTFAEYVKDNKAGNHKKARLVNIYPEHKKDGHQWAMAIDLASCTGCSSCIISCNAENNVPVVGRQEVKNRREMHWLRIDRYYKGDENQPEVMNMPMLCQHCENAPCENVCPVMATLHSSDGLNQQVYNRCVGTRYCANNCPYKVRRFNWFNYDRGDKLERMVLNPDVSNRTRGIMEKCSMCVQRIQEGKLQAKKERRALKDGDIKLACQQSCPGDGIVFGDMNDPKSKISKFLGDERNYTVLEELNVRPRISYLTKIRNK
jgi:molybdopterin-containing oxidoreductase family iron-sulfur binding subunit